MITFCPRQKKSIEGGYGNHGQIDLKIFVKKNYMVNEKINTKNHCE